MFELEGISELVVYMALMIVGAVAGIILPYLINMWLDKDKDADWKYVAVLLIGIVAAVFVASPNKVTVIDVDAIKAAILGGYATQAIVNKIVSAFLEKRKLNTEELKEG